MCEVPANLSDLKEHTKKSKRTNPQPNLSTSNPNPRFDPQDLKVGLSTNEATTRMRTVGENRMDVDPPTIFGILISEFSKVRPCVGI